MLTLIKFLTYRKVSHKAYYRNYIKNKKLKSDKEVKDITLETSKQHLMYKELINKHTKVKESTFMTQRK